MSALPVTVQRISDDSFVSGEGVKLDLTPASPFTRAGAFFMDTTVYIATFVILYTGNLRLWWTKAIPWTLSTSLSTLIVFFSLALLPFLIESFTRGYSLGKWAFNLKVVRRDGGIITARHALVRSLTALVEIYLCLGAKAFISSMFSPQARRLGDLAAGTVVVQIPQPVFYPPLVMPPDCAAWASAAQVMPIPDKLQYECVQFLRTNREITDQLRLSIALSLASRLSPFVSPQPPADVHPERFIAAVLVVLRDREYAKELRRQEKLELRREQVARVPFEI